jgi:hypothetical protein
MVISMTSREKFPFSENMGAGGEGGEENNDEVLLPVQHV